MGTGAVAELTEGGKIGTAAAVQSASADTRPGKERMGGGMECSAGAREGG
jgi:hypothetical protein